MSSTSEHRVELSPEEKRALLARMLQEEASQPTSFPLSFAQQRLWFLHQFEPRSPAYNLSSAVTLSGPLNVTVLEQSLNEIVRRHDSLRTTFTMADGQPVQVVAPTLSLTLPVVDLRGLPKSAREAQAQQLATEETHRPFDLARGPVFRAVLLRLAKQDHVLLLTMHHIISDGWSLGVLLRELNALYEAYSKGQPSPLPELPIQYADYAVWQRQRLQGWVLEKQLAYWRQQLADVPVLELPTDRPRPAVKTYQGTRRHMALPEDVSRALRALSQQEGVTLFMTLLAAFQTLLCRYTGQTDIAVGTPVAGRTRAETEGLIGFFVNTLVLRTDLSGNPRFRELLGRVRAACVEAYAHQDVPFEKLVEELQPRRDLSRTPLFQVMFTLQSAGGAEPSQHRGARPLAMSSLKVERGTAKFDMMLTMIEGGRALTGMVEYSTDLFEAASIERLWGHFRTLLAGIVANPEQRLGALPLLTEAERRQLLVEWGSGRMGEGEKGRKREQGEKGTGMAPRLLSPFLPFSFSPTLPFLFEAQARKTPEAVAAVFEDAHLSYQELNWRANELAGALQALGVGPEVRVGICVERSLDMLIGLLGILKAGGAYVPLDPAYPRERLAFMLEDSQAPVLLTQTHLLDQLPEHQAQVVCLDHWLVNGSTGQRVNQSLDSFLHFPISPLPHFPIDSFDSGVEPDNLAYVIYTSGSTGKPKGVQIEHRSVVNFLLAMRQRPGLTAADRLLAVTTLSFDIAGLELFLPLSVGACVEVVSREVAGDAGPLAALLEAGGITVMQATPATWRMLLEGGWTGKASLKVLCGGEALSRELAQALREKCASVWNLYGPTETTIWSAALEIQDEAGAVPIGGPIANTTVYVLDEHGQPVPVGVAGELYIGGAGVARGYLNRPELTAERFVPDPFSPRVGSRLYRTGDVVRYRGDGRLEFLGRVDHQVKVRGFRIELGEIEAVLNQHQGVQQAVVVAREDEVGEKQLVAYVVPKLIGQGVKGSGGQRVHEAMDSLTHLPVDLHRELRRYVKERLPEYMTPSAFVLLDALPLTPNGKVDRRALPAPEWGRSEIKNAFVAPRTPVEELVADIWAQVLRVGQVGVNDNFFELGGHSLLATQVIARVRQVFNIAVPLRALFEGPTVACLAERIEMTRRREPKLETPPLRPVSRDSDLPLSFAQERVWFLDQLEPGTPAYNVRSATRLSGALNVAALEQSLNEVVRRHEVLRTSFPAVNGLPRQHIAPARRVTLPVVDLRELPEPEREVERERLTRHAGQRSFDLARGPLWQMILVRVADEEYALLLTIHHIVFDEWSRGIFFRELWALYAASVNGTCAPLPELAVQYADYAVWQRQWLRGEVLENEVAYWKQQLAGAPVLELPTDRPRPLVQTFRGARQPLVLSPSLSDGLKTLGRREGVTLFMTLLAAFQTWLYRYTGQDDISVGTFVANRDQIETENVIGFFVNNLVLRTDLSGNPSFRELLGRVREVTLEAYAHQDVPFEKLLEELQPRRDLSRTPLFQVMLVLQNAPRSGPALPSLTARRSQRGGSPRANFDLTLWVAETSERLTATLEYNSDLFDAATITRMLGHFERLLEEIVANPDQRLLDIPLRETEQQRDVEVACTLPVADQFVFDF